MSSHCTRYRQWNQAGKKLRSHQRGDAVIPVYSSTLLMKLSVSSQQRQHTYLRYSGQGKRTEAGRREGPSGKQAFLCSLKNVTKPQQNCQDDRLSALLFPSHIHWLIPDQVASPPHMRRASSQLTSLFLPESKYRNLTSQISPTVKLLTWPLTSASLSASLSWVVKMGII